MKNVYILGECMVELSRTGDGLLKQSYAGDVYNTAVYLKRAFDDFNVNFFTAVGEDSLSDDMVAAFAAEGINTDMVQRSKDKAPGLYMISVDSEGERSFSYWRSDSAARQIMQFVSAENVGYLCMGDLFFFSGISLAVISPNERDIFWQLLRKLKDSGVRIAFDPNYRARMWEDKTEAKIQFERAFRLSDMVLPGIDDLSQLYGFTEFNKIQDFCSAFGIEELVVKNGPDSVCCIREGEFHEVAITPVEQVVDTTSAGDSFNGVYLGARMSGIAVVDAVKLAAAAAGEVIQHPGAIAPKDAFEQTIRPLVEQSVAVMS
ncbi:sugar kinase [Neiella sp. HB171785]|uniref:Sugar kinase n=1 Tax=Neiella litorisoli TaxID=2771431 RepID=A0A8J6QUP6_9GAMM|nr:sugar kinase [Neiella litorisoli]MBD1391069.1 sugar kinase [Neiella litorisoli]